jgi:hypothetical protein
VQGDSVVKSSSGLVVKSSSGQVVGSPDRGCKGTNEPFMLYPEPFRCTLAASVSFPKGVDTL